MRIHSTIALAAVVLATVAGCSSTQMAVDPPVTPQAPSPTGNDQQATLTVSQVPVDDPGADPSVLTPFYLFGYKYQPDAPVSIAFYAGTSTKGTPLATETTRSDASGGIRQLATTDVYGFTKGDQYTVTASQGGKVLARKQFKSLGTPSEPPQLSMFGFTSMCKPDPSTGQFRITNNYSTAVDYTVSPYNGSGEPIKGTMPPTKTLTYDQWKQFFVPVPWKKADDTWVLSIDTVGTIGPKAVGDNTICGK